MNKGFHFEPSTHTYTFDGKRMTGVTTILGVIAKPALISWASNQAVDYIVGKSRATKDVFAVSVTKQELEEARTAFAKKRDKAAESGTDIHDWRHINLISWRELELLLHCALIFFLIDYKGLCSSFPFIGWKG